MEYKDYRTASILAHCVQEFNKMERLRILMGHSIEYRDAEKMADFLSQISGRSVPVEEILQSDDEMSNEAIEAYEEWKAFAGLLDLEAVKATCKRIYYDNEYWFLRMKCDMEYPFFMDAVMAWEDEIIGIEGLLYNLQDISLWSGERKPTNIRTFAKQMIKMLRLYEEIVGERKERSA